MRFFTSLKEITNYIRTEVLTELKDGHKLLIEVQRKDGNDYFVSFKQEKL